MHFTTAAIALAAFASSAYAHMEMTNREYPLALLSHRILTISPSHPVPLQVEQEHTRGEQGLQHDDPSLWIWV